MTDHIICVPFFHFFLDPTAFYERGHRVCDQSYKINTIIPAITSLYTNMFIWLITYLCGPFVSILFHPVWFSFCSNWLPFVLDCPILFHFIVLLNFSDLCHFIPLFHFAILFYIVPFWTTSVSGRLTPPLTPLTTPANARSVRKKFVTYTFSLHCYIDTNNGGTEKHTYLLY